MPKKPFRVLQLIDSLNAGGSEKMAVQLANSLTKQVQFSGLISSRESGALVQDIEKNVIYKCLYRQSRFDFSAVKQLKAFVEHHDIQLIHAHSTSFFLASMLKCLKPSIKLIWHDHYGFRYQTRIGDNIALYCCSVLFHHIIAINTKLSDWAASHLHCKHISCIENFSIMPLKKTNHSVQFKGQIKTYKIIHVANLRPEKDHLTALKAMNWLLDKGYGVSYHSIGAIDKSSLYYKSIQAYIDEHKLNENIHFYDSQTGIYDYLHQADLGLLSSVSEGFPVSLVEYANAKLPVVVTDVGDCKKIVGQYASVVKPGDFLGLALGIEENIQNSSYSKAEASNLHDRVNKTYNHSHILNKILDIYTKVENTSG